MLFFSEKCANQKYQLGLFFELNIKARLAPVVAIAVAVGVVVAAAAVAVVAAAVAVVAAAVAVVAVVVAVAAVAAVLRKVRASFTLANFFANKNASIFLLEIANFNDLRVVNYSTKVRRKLLEVRSNSI